MRKTKTYEISVIDKTYSKTISDETKFYTSDTALELVFKLKETEYTFESAEIVLLNIDDRSLVTRPVTKSLDSFAYELDDDIIPHYGEWHGQLRFEAGETYVSSPVKFRIENDLSNDRPPQLSDVQSWVSLKRYADKMTEELKQAVLSVEGIEDTFNANETVRQTTFETSEQSRQTTFETNESERVETFETNEDIRQTQELEREEAEGHRQSVFNNNEANRTETFNANEATRQENETTRQQEETQRATAESSRVSAEEQRKIDHENRSAELDGKADKVVLKNLIENGDFSDGLNEWSYYNLDAEIVNGKIKATITDTNVSPTSSYFGKSGINLYKNNEYYMRFEIEPKKETLTNIYINGNWAGGVRFPANELSIYSGVAVSNSTKVSNSPDIRINHRPDENYVIGDTYTLDNVVMIDLTKTFGAGNEPTKEEMDELIKITGYIDGEYALNNKDLMIWTLSLVRSNRNAIISLGGTI